MHRFDSDRRLLEKNEILVVYGDNPTEMAQKLAEAAGLAELIGDRKKLVGLKPNLVVSRPASDGATTHPEIAAGLINYLKAHGFNNLIILEGSWTGDSTSRAFAQCGYAQLSRDTGVKLIDTQKDTFTKRDCKGVEIEICDSALKVDFMINLPVLKGHCQTLLTCALKNNKGIIPDREKRRFHSMGLHKPIAHLNTVAHNDFILVDGICGDPDFEEGGNPVYGGRLFAAIDPVLCDAYAAGLIGLNINEIPYISMAEKLNIGVTGPAIVREINKSPDAPKIQPAGRKVKQLSGGVKEDGACSSCYAALIFALLRLEKSGIRGPGELCIGQGFRGKNGRIGIGNCTAGFSVSCAGCPPSGMEIMDFLTALDQPIIGKFKKK